MPCIDGVVGSPKSYSSENAVMLVSASTSWDGRISCLMDSLGFVTKEDPSSTCPFPNESE